MDIILEKAKQFTTNYFPAGVMRFEELLQSAKKKINEIDGSMDKIKFINFVLDKNNIDYEKHKIECKDLEHCRLNFAHESIAYDLMQQLKRLGVSIDDDAFTTKEKTESDSKLDKILADLQNLKIGQQIIYDDLQKEISELKDLYFLGKKKWYQLFVGKSFDMVASGIISETISKQIIEEVKRDWPLLLR